MHHRIGENEAAPNNVDVYFPAGSANPQLYHIGCQVFCTAWQALYVVIFSLPMLAPAKGLCAQAARCEMRSCLNPLCPPALLFN